MARLCAAAITAEMNDYVKLGGGNSGCCGNTLHRYGFHLPANELPASDYSRTHEKAVPRDMSWCCAGDFGHSGNTALRARHASVLSRLMRDDPSLSMICEFIGMPYTGKPVYYWARWNGVQTLKKYTGSGHDTWSHISWWRSRAHERAYLWTPASTTETVKPASTPTTQPAYPGYVIRFNPAKTDPNLKVWQARMKTRGWAIDTDGVFGPGTKRVVLAFQTEKHLQADGEIGPLTWAAAWTSAVTA